MRTGAALLLAGLTLTPGASADDRLTDDEVRAQIIQSSIAGYPGSCPCPYQADRAGRRCGERSAWSKLGGEKPMCYPADVSDEQVKRWRQRTET